MTQWATEDLTWSCGSTSLLLRNISEWREILTYSVFNYKSPWTFEYPAQSAWMYSQDPFTGYATQFIRPKAVSVNDLLAGLFLWTATFFATLLLFDMLLSCSFLANPRYKIHTYLLKKPLYRHIWVNPFRHRSNYLIGFWNDCCFFYTLFAHYQCVSSVAQSVFSITPSSTLHYGPVVVLVTVDFLFTAAYKDLTTYLTRLLKFRYLYNVKWSWSLITWASLVLRCIDFGPPYFRAVLDCFTVIYIWKRLSVFGGCRFGLEVSETRWWWPEGEYTSKPYNPWKILKRNSEVERLGFGAFRFVPFGAFTLKYHWFVIATLPAVPVAVALSIWADDKHIMLPILNLVLLYFIAHTVLSTAKVMFSMSGSCMSTFCRGLLCFLMLDILIFFFTIPISHVGRFVLEEEGRHGWSSIRRALAFGEGLLLLQPLLTKEVYSGAKSFFWPGPGRREWFVLRSLNGRHALAVGEELMMLLLLLTKEVYSGVTSFFWPDPGRKEWFVLGSLSGIRVSAIPDTGSDLDIVSVDFIKRHGITIDSTSRQCIQLPNGKANSIGTVSLPFLFEGEKSTFSRVFTVMPNCLHDVILSHSFLRTTETLTKFSRRLKSKFVPSLHMPRLRLLGTPKQRIWGSINGRTVAAIPDTGSDVMLMSKRYARKLGLNISKGAAHKSCLEFADGTLANTCGMVFGVEWKFGKQSSTFQYCDFHIMEDLPYKVILSNDFLFKSKAFSKFKDFFFEQRNDADLSRVFHELSLIKIVGRQNKAIGRIHGFCRRFLRIVKGSPTSGGTWKETKSAVQEREEHLRRELQRQDVAEELIAELSPEQQEAAWAAERCCREQWTKTHPPIAQSSASQ